MTDYIAFLRGINVGGNKKVDMARLKTMCESLGWTHVRTYINSGNIMFQTEETKSENLAQLLEGRLAEEFGFEVKVIIRSAHNIQHLSKQIPTSWTNDGEYKTDILFLSDDIDSPDVTKRIDHNPIVDDLRYIDGAVVWHLNRKDYNKSGMKSLIGTHVYKNMTARNINTVRKLAQLLED